MGKMIKVKPVFELPEYTGVVNEVRELELSDDRFEYAHMYGKLVGVVYEDGEVKSLFAKDKENDSTEIFDRLRSDYNLFSKIVHLRQGDGSVRGCERFYILHNIEGHSSTKPTVTDTSITGACNASYEVSIEVLLVSDEGLKRYLTIDYTTGGNIPTTLVNIVKDLEDTVEEYFEDELHGFTTDCGELTVAFYEDTGEITYINVYSVDELLAMVASVRLIDVKCTIM